MFSIKQGSYPLRYVGRGSREQATGPASSSKCVCSDPKQQEDKDALLRTTTLLCVMEKKPQAAKLPLEELGPSGASWFPELV